VRTPRYRARYVLIIVTRALLLADTHIGGRHRDRRLPAHVIELAAKADVILHAGDITDARVLDELAVFAPVHAVLGNNDVGLMLPARRLVVIGGCTVAMVHDSGASGGRTRRLRHWFPAADAVVFGHSHVPWHEIDRRAGDGHEQHQINPGSPTERRRAPHPTVAWLCVDDGTVTSVEHVDIDRSARG